MYWSEDMPEKQMNPLAVSCALRSIQNFWEFGCKKKTEWSDAFCRKHIRIYTHWTFFFFLGFKVWKKKLQWLEFPPWCPWLCVDSSAAQFKVWTHSPCAGCQQMASFKRVSRQWQLKNSWWKELVILQHLYSWGFSSSYSAALQDEPSLSLSLSPSLSLCVFGFSCRSSSEPIFL